MFITTEIRRTVDDARAALTDPKPLQAVAGAGDLLVERVRTAIAAQQRALQSVRFEPSAVPALVNATVDNVRGAITGFPERAQDAVAGTAVRASIAYEDLAQRGAKLVRRVQRQRASHEMADQVENTVRAAKATSTTARKASAATISRVKATATSARKTTPRKTTTSARKTTTRKTTTPRKVSTAVKKSSTAKA